MKKMAKHYEVLVQDYQKYLNDPDGEKLGRPLAEKSFSLWNRFITSSIIC